MENNYLQGFKECLDIIEEQANRSTNNYLNGEVNMSLMVAAWNEVMVCIERCKLQYSNMADDKTISVALDKSVNRFKLIKNEE